MKSRFGKYFAAWAILLALFNVIAFLAPESADFEKYTESFWIGYGLITVTFLGQLACAYTAFKESNLQKLFYRVSLISLSYGGLIATFFVGGLCMLLPFLPYWFAGIVCAIVLAANAIAVIKASAVVDEVERIDTKIKQQTFFIKSLTVDAESLLARAKSEEVKAECKKVYEAVRYSDPMSSDMLSSVEGQITVKFSALSDAVAADDAAAVAAVAAELLIFIKDRNAKCKLLK